MKTKKKTSKSEKKSSNKKKISAKKTQKTLSTPIVQREERFQSLNDMVAKQETQPTVSPFVAEWLTNNPDKWDPEFTQDPCECAPEKGCLDVQVPTKSWFNTLLSMLGFRKEK